MDRLERYPRNAVCDYEHTDTEPNSCPAQASAEVTQEELTAPIAAGAAHDIGTMPPHEPVTSHGPDNVSDVVVPASPMPTVEASAEGVVGPELMALRREVFSLTAGMSAEQLAAIIDPAVRAAGVLMADLLHLREHDAAALTMLVAGIETPEAGRHGEMAVALYREALAIRSDAKRKAFKKKRTGRIKSLSDFGRDVLLDEVARLRGLRA